MPKNGNVGYSENTPLKQEHFRTLLATHMRAVKSIIQRYSWVEPTYCYIDLNAGPGRYPVNGQPIYGSPLEAYAIAKAINLPIQGFLCEQGLQELHDLRHTLITQGLSILPGSPEIFTDREHISLVVAPGDYHATAQTLLSSLPPKQYGLIYSDENGSLPPFELLREYSEQLEYLDIVIHVACSPIKWQRVSPTHALQHTLEEFMRTIAKRYWLIREPYLKHQWTFLIGTNWQAFPKFRRQGFWPVDSAEGSSILRRVSLTNKERRTHEQYNLFPQETSYGGPVSA